MPSAQSEKSQRLILEIRESKSVLICQHCDRPVIELAEGDARILSKHGREKHENILTAEYLEMLAAEMRRQRAL